jgi:hypothetical protein
MRIIRNERHIRISNSIGKYALIAGLLVLAGGFILSLFKMEWVGVILASLVVGIALSLVGGFFFDRYVGALAHHEALANVLKGLDDRYALFQYTLPASHVLLEPGGLTVFVVKAQGGEVIYQGEGRWKHRQRGKFFRQFAGQEAVGSPHLEAEYQVRRLERWLSRQLPEVNVPVRGVVVFVNPQVTLQADNAPVPTFYGKKLKNWLRGAGKLKPLPESTYRQVAEALGVK